MFGPTATSDEVVSGVDLSGRTVVVTGATSGIGRDSARALAGAGAQVVLAVRDLDKGRQVVAELRDEAPSGSVATCGLDVSSLASVRDAAAELVERFPSVDVLVNNAGIMAVPFAHSVDGIELQLATNHLGHFLLTTLLLPSLRAAAPSRVVNVTSRGHRIVEFRADDLDGGQPYDRWDAYSRSKSANILFTIELERRYADDGIHAFAANPGMVRTNMARHLTREDLREMGARSPGGTSTLKTLAQGSATPCWAATAPELEGRGGLYVENCHVSGLMESADAREGHAPWATDPVQARRLWERSEEMIRRVG